MSNHNQNNPGQQQQNEGPKPDLQQKKPGQKSQEELNRDAEKERDEKRRQGGDDEIKESTNSYLY